MPILENVLSAARPELTPLQLEQLRAYYELLEETNKVMNLTAISGEADVAALHFLDSLALTDEVDLSGKRVIDIGSGAGFPGIPLKIACPDMELTLLDALNKRVEFMRNVCDKIGVDAVALHARAEETARKPEYREKFDLAVSRAVANLNMLCELCIPFIKVGGTMAAMKSTDTDAEIKSAERCIEKLGCKLEKTVDYTVGGTDIVHRIVLIRKVRPTPRAYPRRFAKIQKEPL